MAGTYTLELELFSLLNGSTTGFEIWADGSMMFGSPYTVSSDGTTISVTVPYGGALPTSLEFRFNDTDGGTVDQIEVRFVTINDRYVNTGNYLSGNIFNDGTSQTVDVTNNAFLFDASEPAPTEFTVGATQTFTVNNDSYRGFNDATPQVFDMLAGRDTAYLGAGADKVNGGDGNDTLYGFGGDDLLFGDAGNDRIYGGDNNDTLFGGDGNDRVHGNDGNDEIHGGAGDDRLNGHTGDDIITGGTGADKINGGSGNNFLFGDDGDDQIVGGADNDTIDGGADNDLLYGLGGIDQMNGGDGDDVLVGGTGDDIMHGDGGNDTVIGGNDNDTLFGGDGRDDLFGGDGVDNLNGGDGDDDLFGGLGNDTLNGDAGADSLNGSDGQDILNGGAGNDTIFGDDGAINFEGGLLVIEAENYENKIDRNGKGWNITSDAAASGGKVVTAGPNTGTILASTGIEDTAAELTYTVNFTTTGTFYVWIKAGVASGGSNDSVHLGFDGVQQTGNGGVATGSNYGWHNTETGTGTVVTVNVTTIGEHVLNLWMREDGTPIDKIIIADTIGFTPTGLGPDQTLRTSVSGDVDTIDGGDGDDTIFGDLGDDVIDGGADNDIIYGGADNDTINGGSGIDNIFGDDGNDTINGGAGVDTLIGGTGDDIINGGDDNDVIIGDSAENSAIDGLVAYYKLDEASGTTVTDYSGNNNDGIYTGGTPVWAPYDGQVGGAIDFAGKTDESIEVGTWDVNGTGITLSAWIFYDSITNDARIISKTDGAGTTNHDWGLLINDNNGGEERLEFRMTTVNGYSTERLEGFDFANTIDTWTHVTVTYDDTSDLVSYYIDGQLEGTDTHNAGGAVISGTGEDIAIGNQPNSISSARQFDGKIDDLRVYERELSAAEVLEIFQDRVGDGDDTIDGGDGDDDITGGAGNDSIIGGAGNDTIYGVDSTNSTISSASSGTINADNATFDSGFDGYVFVDDFFGTGTAAYSSGTRDTTTGGLNNGSLRFNLGGVDDNAINDMSASYQETFTKSSATSTISLQVSHRIFAVQGLDAGEDSFAFYSLDRASGGGAFALDTVTGASTSTDIDTGWITTTIDFGVIAAGFHTIDLGGYLTRKTFNTEEAQVWFDDVTWIEQDISVNTGITNTISGGSGLDTLYGSTETDIFVFESTSAFLQRDIIENFNVLDDDQIDISDLLTGFVAGTDNIAEFVNFVTSGSNTILQVDSDGAAGGTSYVDVAQINDLTNLDEAALFDSGALIT